MTLPEALDEIAANGWLVNNLFQLNDGLWQANLRRERFFTEFGRGPAPEAALEAAMAKMEEAEPSEFDLEPYEAKAFKEPSLLALLGLAPKPFTRRF